MPRFTNDDGTIKSLTIRGQALDSLRIDLRDRIISAKLSFSTSQVSQLDLQFVEKGDSFDILRSGIFQAGGTDHAGTQCDVADLLMQVGSITVGSLGRSVALTVQARSLGGQRLMNNRDPAISSNISYAEWTRRKVASLGLVPVVQDSYVVAKTGNEATPNGTYGTSDSYTTIQSYAGKLGYLAFEVANNFFFGKPTWIVTKTPRHKYTWAGPDGDSGPLLEIPAFRSTGDDPVGVSTVSLKLAPGTQDVYPGDGIDLMGVPGFDGTYLVTDVTYDLTPDGVVQVSAKTPVDPKATENPVTVTQSPVLAAAAQAVGVPAPGRYGDVTLSASQIGYAVTIAKTSKELGLTNPRAAVLGIMCAMQESTLRNLAGGDRDSVGLFQQRPSQGWGTRAQCMDPTHAATAFYNALVKMVPDYATHSPLWDAIADVQRPANAYRSYYGKWQAMASELVAAIFSTQQVMVAFTATSAPAGAEPSYRPLSGSQTYLQLQDIASYGPAHVVTSTTGGSHSSTSYHYRGQADDFGVNGNNQAGLKAIADFWRQWAGYATELIYYPASGNGTLAVKNGKPFTYSAAIQAQHRTHVHVAFTPDALRATGIKVR